MKEYVYDNLLSCCDAFQSLLLEDRYLSRRDLEQFQDRYKDSFYLIDKGYVDKNDIIYKKIISITNDGYNVISKRNKIYLNRKLNELKDYFANIFNDTNPNIKLDEEQMKSILIDEDYSLIIAPPGTGKTTIAIAKIKYLIDIKKVDPSSIIFVCKTKKKAKEVKDIINKIFKIDISVLTPSELSMYFIEKNSNIPYTISNYDNMYNIIYKYIRNEIFPNKEKLKYIMSIFSKYLFLDNNCYDCLTYDEYIEKKKEKKYLEYKNDLDKFIINKTKSLKKQYKTIKGEILRSINEVQIANYLYLHGIDYEYYAKENIDDYVADFIININGKNLYIEYYGLTNLKADGTYMLYDTNLKRNLKLKQKALRKKYGKNLIELYSGSEYLKILDKELEKRGIDKKLTPKKDVFNKIISATEDEEIKPFITLVANFINRFKEKEFNLQDFDYLIKSQYKDNLKKQLILIKDIYEYYDEYLANNNMIDINDLLNKAISSLDKLNHDRKINLSYLILDDYQSMSYRHNEFAKKISTLFKAKIIVLGDDWETIYAMGKNDVNLFKDFYQLMGYANIIRISNSYRISQEIIDIANNYINDDFSLYSKNLISTKHTDKPIKINYYLKDNIYEKFLAIDAFITKIYRENKNSKILILSPYSTDINEYIEKGYFKKGRDGLLISKTNPKAHIEFHSISETKGLEYDQVILLANQNGYDFEEQDELLKILDNTKTEIIEIPEDRKLFYIALTKTKNKLYIVSPTTNTLINELKIAINE